MNYSQNLTIWPQTDLSTWGQRTPTRLLIEISNQGDKLDLPKRVGYDLHNAIWHGLITLENLKRPNTNCPANAV